MAEATIRSLVGLGALAGIVLLGAADVQAHHHNPPQNYPPVDPAFVHCEGFMGGNANKCYDTANEVYQINAALTEGLSNNDFTVALQISTEHTPQMFPNGSVSFGLSAENFALLTRWAGTHHFSFISVVDSFEYKPVDKNNVVLFGPITFTINDLEHGTTRIIHSLNTEVFRRDNHAPLGWVHVYEQLAYVQTLIGDE